MEHFDDQNENAIRPTTVSKTNPKSTKNSYDLDWIKHTNANAYLPNDRHILKKPVTDQGCQKRLSKYNGIVNRMTSDVVDEELRKRQLSTSGDIEIRRVRLKHFYKAQLTLGSENPLPLIEQHFEYIAVVDFEATCELNAGNHFPHEIIEFPIVLINVPKRTIVDKVQFYCRPTIKPTLSNFCTELTGITQAQVDVAPVFSDVLQQIENWLNDRDLYLPSNKRKIAFATDGPWDFAKFLRMQCRFSSIGYPRWARKWINVRKEFSNFYSVKRCGIGKMLQMLGLTFDGRSHSGLDDSINIARIALELIQDGCVLLLNDGLRSGGDPKFLDMNSSNTTSQTNANDDEEPMADHADDDYDDDDEN